MFKKDLFKWLATEIAPMIYPSDIEEFANKVKAKSKNSRFDRNKFLEVSRLSWEGRNSPYAQEDWLSNDLDKQYQEGKRNGSDTKAA